jgi:queuine tRNA-ribosyltransferase
VLGPPLDDLPDFPFVVEATDGRARAGRLETPRGAVLTPCFMPVGTKGTVKAMLPDRLAALGAQVVLANTYHLALRPGSDVVADLGGLHRFAAWDGPMLTDSGGFQVFSLRDTADIGEEGVAFRSVYDGSRHLFTPERSIGEQQRLGADLVMCFDECAPAGAPREALARAVERTSLWAARCRSAHAAGAGMGNDGPQMLLGIVQGGTEADMRRESAESLVALRFPGYAIGGLSVGEDRAAMLETTSVTAELLPQTRVRYFMGIGDPVGVLEVIERGVDLFDCVLPTRIARMGTALSPEGRLNMRNAAHVRSREPIQPGCPCTACTRFTRGAIRHFVMQKEIVGMQLLTEHNLMFLFRLVAGAREAIFENRFQEYKKQWMGSW